MLTKIYSSNQLLEGKNMQKSSNNDRSIDVFQKPCEQIEQNKQYHPSWQTYKI